MRGFDSDKYCPPLGADRTATLEILGHGAADVRGQWNAFDRVRLGANDNFAGSPVDIVQPELGYFARPHTETDQHGENGDVSAAAPRGVVARREKASNLVGSQSLGSPTNRRPATDGTADEGVFNDAVEMQEPEKRSKGRDCQFRCFSTLSRTTVTPKEMMSAAVRRSRSNARQSAESRPRTNGRTIEVGARCDCRQSALDGQVTPELIEHYVDRTEDCVGSLSRYDLKPLKIIKYGAHRPDRGISGVAGSPTMTQETIRSLRLRSAVAMPWLESQSLIGQNLHLQADGSRRISQLRRSVR